MLNLLILLQSFLGMGSDAPATDDKATEAAKIGADVAEWKSLSLNELINMLAEKSVHLLINVAVAIIVFYAGRFIIRKIYRLVNAIFIRRDIDKSLSVFILSLLNIVLYFILIVTVIGILGIETTSFLALFASAGVAIGMALSGTLQNFAGGVLILLLKPYRVGDYIEAQGYAGTVREIQIFFTVLTTPDFKTVLIPNGALSTGSLNNWTRQEFRRISWTVSISYGDDVAKARKAILEMLDADDRIRKGNQGENGIEVLNTDGTETPVAEVTEAEKEPVKEAPAKRKWYQFFSKGREHAREVKNQWEEAHNTDILQTLYNPDMTPKVYVGELGASSVDLSVRAWVDKKDYWDVYYRFNELFYTELPSRGGISFPFPQMDVHINGAIEKIQK